MYHWSIGYAGGGITANVDVQYCHKVPSALVMADSSSLLERVGGCSSPNNPFCLLGEPTTMNFWTCVKGKERIGLYSAGFMDERREVSFCIYFPCWCLVDQMTPHSPLFLSVLLLKCFVCLIAAPTKHKTYTIKWAISIQGFFVICGEFLLSNMFIMHIFIKTKTIKACSNRSTLEETNKQLMWSSSIWFWGGSWVFILIALSSMPKSILLIVRQTTQQSTK